MCCYGWVITQGSAVVDRGHRYEISSGNPGSSAAELEAMRSALSSGLEIGLSDSEDIVRVVGDNQSVIYMCSGDSAPSSKSSVTGVQKIWNLSKSFSNIRFEWVPRERNVETDSLCYKAYREALNGGDRGKLMSAIHSQARKRLGKKLNDAVLDSWIKSVVGRTSLLRASTSDLRLLLDNVDTLDRFAI